MALLSVVLPVYNVEAYLRDCLDSLARQTHRDLEVVMVNDGSTDRSAEIAAEMVDRDDRFRLVHQENNGLGHARNTGARLATGDFITFVDSDDIVPHYACRTVIRTLEETGSDFLSGNEYRIDSRGAHPAPMLESNFAVTRLRTNVAKRPALLRDLLPHNKIYRKAFWDAAGLEFPEGILFEDGPVSVRAHALAKSVDIVSTPIYYWRLRDDASRSLSQLVDDERFFVDRIFASTLSADFLKAHRPELLAEFYSWDMQHKFTVMYKALPQAPRDVQERFIQAAVPHLQRVPAEVIRRLPPALQRRVELTQAGGLDAILAELPQPTTAVMPTLAPASPALAGARKTLARSRTLQMLRAYARMRPSEGVVRSSVMELTHDGDRLYLRGYGHIGRLPTEGRLTAANRVLWARHQESRRLVRLRMRSRLSPEATAAAGDAHFSYRRSGFEATLRLADLQDQAGNWQYGSWLLALGALTTRGVARGGLRVGVEAYRTDPLPITLDQDTRLIPTVTNGVLGFRIEKSGVALEECRLDGDSLVLTGRIVGAPEPAATLVLGRVNGAPEHSVPVEWLPGQGVPNGRSRFTARVSLPELLDAVSPVAPTPVAGIPDRLYVGLRTGELAGQQIACEPDFVGSAVTVADHHMSVQPANDGYLAVTVRPPGPVVTAVSWTPSGELRLTGSGADQVAQFQLIGRHSSNTERRVLPSASQPDGSWQAHFSPERVPLVGAATALRAGQWRLVLRTTDRSGNQLDTDLPYSPQIFSGAEPNRIAYEDRYWVKRVGLDGLALRVNSRLAEDERGTYHSTRLRDRVYLGRGRGPLREAVLYDSFNGKQYSDAPRAVHEALCARNADVEHIWVTRDGQAPVPAGTRTVEANSREWFEALATSRYIVANTHLPPWIERRKGQVVAQTWHGIGFKRVAFDMDSVQFANPTYLEKLEQEAPNWSFLVSPSSFCTEIMRRAFRYDGEICEIGSPRNDLLFTGDRTAIADRVRQAVGIPADRKILLYAPTWRDNAFYGPGRYRFDMQLDVSQFPPELQREYVLLVRRHPNTVDDLLGQDSDFVYDVANYPDVRDLLVAADVLVTDYSTISLDFLNTGRPVLYYTYDLASYRDNLRGFYFDLEGEGPGPVLETTPEVVAALRDLDGGQRQYRDRYERFRQIYCHAEDGHATDRLIDRLFNDAR
jgi:CDP-glycerol glycerophosphotransferase